MKLVLVAFSPPYIVAVLAVLLHPPPELCLHRRLCHPDAGEAGLVLVTCVTTDICCVVLTHLCLGILEPHPGHAHPPRLLTRPLAHWRLSRVLQLIGELSLRLLRPVTRHGRGRVPGSLASDFLLELLHFRILIMDHGPRPQVLD